MNNWTDASGDWNPRGDGLKWSSPTLAGFVVSAAVIETAKKTALLAGATNENVRDGQGYGIDLKYAGEFSGIRIAAGIGYELLQDGEPTLTALSVNGSAASKITTWGGSLALMHVPTGLFIQGDYVNKERENAAAGACAAGFSCDATRWNVQGGISQNWFGIGKTALYGEYGRGKGWLELNTTSLGHDAAIDSTYKVWGVGVVQNIDAAAMELYAGYRSFSFSEGANAVGAFVGSGDVKLLSAGARIKF
jgi:hypothetical protein